MTGCQDHITHKMAQLDPTDLDVVEAVYAMPKATQTACREFDTLAERISDISSILERWHSTGRLI